MKIFNFYKGKISKTKSSFICFELFNTICKRSYTCLDFSLTVTLELIFGNSYKCLLICYSFIITRYQSFKQQNNYKIYPLAIF